MSTANQQESSPKLEVTGAPQFHDRTSTARVMWSVVLCLLPATAWGVAVFGPHAAAVLAVAIAVSVFLELLIDRVGAKSASIARTATVRDGSAVLTGLLIGMSMPPEVPLFIPAAASAFAIVVVKWTFGGLGSNWMNPALAGRVFVFFSWTGAMTRWTMPSTLVAGGARPLPDVLSGATPLGLVKTHLSGTGPIDVLRQLGFPQSRTDIQVTSWINGHLLDRLGAHLPGGYIDPFIGNVPGSIGEVSALLLLLGSVFMFGRRIIRWEIPSSYFLSFALLTWIFGGVRYHAGYFTGDVLFQILTGGFMLALFYMATDPVTSPMSSSGMLIYGIGVGSFTFLIRTYGSYPEGVALAIIFMNIFVPLIDKLTAPRRYGARTGREARVANQRSGATSEESI